MARFFKGSGPGSHYWLPSNSPKTYGFRAPPGAPAGPDAAVRHITNYSWPSPYVSISSSYGIARSYALSGPFGAATPGRPGRVWEIQFEDQAVRLEHPTYIIAGTYPEFVLHDGDSALLAILADGKAPTPTSVDGFQVNWKVPQELLAVVKAIRDAEMLADYIAPSCVVGAKDVW